MAYTDTWSGPAIDRAARPVTREGWLRTTAKGDHAFSWAPGSRPGKKNTGAIDTWPRLYLLSAPVTIPLVCCHINNFRRASSGGEAMARRRKEDQRAGLASGGIGSAWGVSPPVCGHRGGPDRERVPERCNASGVSRGRLPWHDRRGATGWARGRWRCCGCSASPRWVATRVVNYCATRGSIWLL